MKIYVGKSKLHGKGIFALKYIKKDERIALIEGRVVSHIVIDKKTSSMGPNWIGISKNKWIDPAFPFYYLNHSCNPNAGIKGSKSITALRNIKRDEEISIDYSTTEEDILWKLPKKCNCGSKNCRKIIRSIQFLPKKVFNNYLPYIPKYFQKVYIKYNKNHGS